MESVSENLRLSVLQYAPRWELRDANLRVLDEMAAAMPATDVLLLPEMFATGFSMRTQVVAELTGGPVCAWMRRTAGRTEALVVGSVAVSENGRCYNRLYGVSPDGEVRVYDKRHLFRMGKEHLHYTPGKERPVWRWKGWRLLPQVCYDLRFPAWSRCRNDYDVALYATNWPAPRHEVMCTLARARALENSCYVAVTNRLGTDEGRVAYDGASQVVDFRGRVMASAGHASGVVQAVLSMPALAQFRRKFPVWMDADFFALTP